MVVGRERLSPMALPAHDVLWASPECTGHTRARGKERLHHDASRATAWCPIRVADYHRPPLVLCENVVDLRRWDMLRAWLVAWECLGYVEDTARPGASLDASRFDPAAHGAVLDSADFGVPQSRPRLFFVFRDPRQAPAPVDIARSPSAHVPVRGVIDWDTSRGFWSPWRDLCDDTRGRIEAELARSRPADGRVMVAYHGSETHGRSLDRPCGTLDRNDRYRVVSGELSRHLRVGEVLAIGGFPGVLAFGPHGITPAGIAAAGNASSPLLNDVDAGDTTTELMWLLLAPRDYLSTFLKIGTIVALAIGIITSVFTAIYITRFIIEFWMARTRPKTITV